VLFQVGAITSAFSEIRPPNWSVSEPYKVYLQSQDSLWTPELSYYMSLIRRLADSKLGFKKRL